MICLPQERFFLCKDLILLTVMFLRMNFNASKGLLRGFAPHPTRVLNTLDPQ